MIIEKRGGKREGAGRKPSKDKKLLIRNYIETSIINALGGEEATRKKLYDYAKLEASRKSNKCASKMGCHFPRLRNENNCIGCDYLEAL